MAGLCSIGWGGFILLAVTGAIGEPEGEGPIRVFYLFGLIFAAIGAMLMTGVASGVKDNGDRPPAMGWPMRVLLDLLGWVFLIGMAVMFSFFALDSHGGWSGDAAVLGRLGFAVIALVLWSVAALALVQSLGKRLGAK